MIANIPIIIPFFVYSKNNTDKISNSGFWWIVVISSLGIILLLSIGFYTIFENKINDFIYECKIFFKDLFKGL